MQVLDCILTYRTLSFAHFYLKPPRFFATAKVQKKSDISKFYHIFLSFLCILHAFLAKLHANTYRNFLFSPSSALNSHLSTLISHFPIFSFAFFTHPINIFCTLFVSIYRSSPSFSSRWLVLMSSSSQYLVS